MVRMDTGIHSSIDKQADFEECKAEVVSADFVSNQ